MSKKVKDTDISFHFFLFVTFCTFKWLNNNITKLGPSHRNTHDINNVCGNGTGFWNVSFFAFVFFLVFGISFNRCTFKIVHWVKLKCTSFVIVGISAIAFHYFQISKYASFVCVCFFFIATFVRVVRELGNFWGEGKTRSKEGKVRKCNVIFYNYGLSYFRVKARKTIEFYCVTETEMFHHREMNSTFSLVF